MKFAHNILKFSKFAQNDTNDETFEKINIVIEIVTST